LVGGDRRESGDFAVLNSKISKIIACMSTSTPDYRLATLPLNAGLEPWIQMMLRLHPIARRHVLKKFKPPMSWFLYKYLPAGRPHSLANLHDVLV
jgi:hypothetical protein